MASLAYPGDVASSEFLLDPVEQASRDERLVLALVTGTAPVALIGRPSGSLITSVLGLASVLVLDVGPR